MSVSNYGIHRKYEAGNQNAWLIKCEHCGHYQEMDFEKNIKIKDESLIDRRINVVKPHATEYVCQKCGKSLESSRWYNGQWVERYPDRDIASFYVSQMDSVWISSDQLYEKSLNAISKQLFYNYTLGMPFENASLSITEDDIYNNARADMPLPVTSRGDYAYISVGIDWGTAWHHFVVLGMRSNGTWDILNLHRVKASHGVENLEKDLDQILMLLFQYQPDIICPDLGFNGNYVDKIKAQFPEGRVYGIKVNPSPKSTNDPNISVNKTTYTITIDKLMQNIVMMSHIKMGRIGFYQKRDENLDLFITHWQNVLIRDELDDKTNLPYRSINRKGGDHFAESSVYAMVGMTQIINELKSKQSSGQITALDVPDNLNAEDTVRRVTKDMTNLDIYN